MSLVVVRNDRSKRVLSLQRESESGTCPTCADTTITSRPCPSPRHSFSFLFFPFFSLPSSFSQTLRLHTHTNSAVHFKIVSPNPAPCLPSSHPQLRDQRSSIATTTDNYRTKKLSSCQMNSLQDGIPMNWPQ